MHFSLSMFLQMLHVTHAFSNITITYFVLHNMCKFELVMAVRV